MAKALNNDYFRNYRNTSEHYREYITEYNKKYYETHKDELHNYNAQYYETNKEYLNMRRKLNYKKANAVAKETKRLGKIDLNIFE